MGITELHRGSLNSPGPCWILLNTFGTHGHRIIPHIICRCGDVVKVKPHQIHDDGNLKTTYYHNEPGCGWHVNIKLLNYDDYTTEIMNYHREDTGIVFNRT